MVSENLHHFVPIFGTAFRAFDMQRVEAAAVGGSEGGELKDLGFISCRRLREAPDGELFKLEALTDELAKRPLGESVLVRKAPDLQLFKAFLLVNVPPYVIKYRVESV